MSVFIRKSVVILAIFGLCLGVAHAKPGKTLHVNVTKAPLLPTPSPFGKALTILTVNDSATVLEEKGSYYKVKTSTGHTGWIPVASLQKKPMDLTKSVTRANGGADNPELASAVPGFNGDVEKQFKNQNPKINFDAVDKMEKWNVTAQESQVFLKQGGLKIQTGDAK